MWTIRTLYVPLERANLSHRSPVIEARLFLTEPLPRFSLRTETNLISETLCSLNYWTMDRDQKLSNRGGSCLQTVYVISVFESLD
jgi:hypothetical protein